MKTIKKVAQSIGRTTALKQVQYMMGNLRKKSMPETEVQANVREFWGASMGIREEMVAMSK